MKRTFWFLAGAGAALGVKRKIEERKGNLNTEALGSMAAGFVGSIFSNVSRRTFDFIDDVRVASKLREREIYDSIDPDQR
jgi:hypothetical protein